MLNFNPNKKNCTGCAACYSACPIHCIAMKRDEEGFLYPEASDACIHCGLCEKVCPSFLPKPGNGYIQKALGAVAKNNAIWRRSASGGAFSEICRAWADDNTLIVGAAWDGLTVHHIGVKGFDSIAPLCKSKYVSSAIEDIYNILLGKIADKKCFERRPKGYILWLPLSGGRTKSFFA